MNYRFLSRALGPLIFLGTSCVCAHPGIATDNENGMYDNLAQVLDKNAAAPEKENCSNRIPFGKGFDCGPNKPGFSFRYGSLFIDSVNLTNWDSAVFNVLEFSDGNCINYKRFEAYWLKSAAGKSAKFLRSGGWRRTEGGGVGTEETFRFHGAKVTIAHRFETDTSCIVEITIEKRFK